MWIRPSNDNDINAIAAIYAHHVRHGTASFEIDPPAVAEIAQRRAEIVGAGLPYLVVERSHQILGYSYASPYRPRPAYRFTVEDSVYLRPDAVGQGIRTLLLNELVRRCTAAGSRQMIAVIGDSNNQASIALHRRCGFIDVGTLRNVGWKHQRWLDTVLMQRELLESEEDPCSL